MFIRNAIKNKKKDFNDLCSRHKVKSLYAFGSSVTPHFNVATSDIDLIVEIEEKDPIERGEYMLSLWNNFEIFFHRKIDLLTDSSIKNPYLRKSIDASKILIYDGSGKKIFD